MPNTNYGWWVWGKDAQGQRHIGGAKSTEAEAYALGYRMFPDTGDFEVKMLPTIDEARAVRMFKMNILDGGSTLEKAEKRFKHHKSVRPFDKPFDIEKLRR